MTERHVTIYTDGDNEHFGLSEIKTGWLQEWALRFSGLGGVHFDLSHDLKNGALEHELPPHIHAISNIRNPDIFFFDDSTRTEIGGVEVTTHSPDGSNIEKRYPFIWASKRTGTSAIVATPYLKLRPNGKINKLPYRHAFRNLQFASTWDPESSALLQTLPIRDLHGSELSAVDPAIETLLFSFSDLGMIFAHLQARAISSVENISFDTSYLQQTKGRLIALANACMDATSEKQASTLLKRDGIWIQIYNARPDSGHWERGEGQFDSIDGRLMFTLDEIELGKVRPARLEFWLPQMTRLHPWFEEQRVRDYGSKRYRNIVEVLSAFYQIRYSNELSDEDWEILKNNPSLLLEREDFIAGLYKFSGGRTSEENDRVASFGLEKQPKLAKEIRSILDDDSLYFATYKPYQLDWREKLDNALELIPTNAKLLLPRISVASVQDRTDSRLIAAEYCSKLHFLALRQIHKVYSKNLKPLS